jgi:purine-nucleoside phosphorylase
LKFNFFLYLMQEQLIETHLFLKNRIADFIPKYGIILGTGLGKLVSEIDIVCEVAYADIPHFVVSTIETHSGKLIFGYIHGKPVVCMQGRFHFYEGYTMQQVSYPVRVMKMLGVQNLLISNASGGLNPAFKERDLMLIEDHISFFLPQNPLVGKHFGEGDRFPDMSQPYDARMLALAESLVVEKGIPGVQKGVYVSVTGPQLETRAEYRLLRQLGADAVGMSTVPEVLVARQINLPVFGISVVTDMCIPESLQVAEISKIISNAMEAEPRMTLIISELIKKLD